MSSIISALGDIATSVVELIWSFFTTAGAIVQKTVEFALKFVTEIFDLAVNFFRGLVDLAGGLVSFVLGTYTPSVGFVVCEAIMLMVRCVQAIC